MKFHIRKKLLAHSDDSKILHDKTVRPDFIKIRKQTVKALCFALFTDSIQSDVYFFPLTVNGLNGSFKLIPGKIRRAKARIKTFQAKIDCIRAFTDCSIKRFDISRRS